MYIFLSNIPANKFSLWTDKSVNCVKSFNDLFSILSSFVLISNKVICESSTQVANFCDDLIHSLRKNLLSEQDSFIVVLKVILKINF